MAAITVGVPVYNGAAHLAQSLDCVLGQTFQDLEVLVFDNASTDDTADIVARYAERDPRVRYHRQPRNKGAVPNFGDLARAATSPYFLWRAADDLSDPNYIEALHRLLEAHPDKQLAVGRVVETFYGGEIRRMDILPETSGRDGWTDRLKIMFGAHATAIYGLYRTPPLVKAMTRIADRYGDPPWGWDFLTLLPFFLDGAVIQTDATTLEFVRPGPPRQKGRRRGPRQEMDFDAMLGARARFLAIAREFSDERHPSGFGWLFSRLIVWAYAGKRVYKVKRIVRRSVNRWLGRKI